MATLRVLVWACKMKTSVAMSKNTVIFPQNGNIVVLIPLHAVISLAVYKHAHSICSCISSAMYTKFICYMHPAMSSTCIL